MTGPRPELDDALRRAMSNQDARPIIVAGAGVTLAATRGEGWTWTGLVHNAIDFAKDSGDIEQVRADKLHTDLDTSHTSAAGTIEVASEIASVLRAHGHFPAWLTSSVGSLQIKDVRLINVLRRLTTTFGAVLATTNYDDLLSQDGGPRPVTWTNFRHALLVIRGHTTGVIHIHGVYTDDASVILGEDDYGRIGDDARAQFLEELAGAGHTLVFVGVGTGVEDPNVGALLEWLDSLDHRHYRLCTEDEANRRAPAVINVPYGSDTDQLVGYLEDLDQRGPIGLRPPPLGTPPLIEVDHGNDVRVVAIDPQGARLATGGPDQMVRVWRLPESPLERPERPVPVREPEWSKTGGDEVSCLAFAPDRTLLAAGTETGARCWRVEDPSTAYTVPHIGRVNALAFDRAGSRLATAGRNGKVNVWDLNALLSGHPTVETFDHGDLESVHDVTFSSDGRWIATIDARGRLVVWPFGQLKPLWRIGEAMTCVAADARGRRLASGDTNGMARVYDTEALTSQDDKSFEDLIRHVWIGQTLASREEDRLREWREIHHGAPVTALCLSDDGHTLVTAGSDGLVVASDISRRQTRTLDQVRLENEAVSADLTQDARLLATATGDSRAHVWALRANA